MLYVIIFQSTLLLILFGLLVYQRISMSRKLNHAIALTNNNVDTKISSELGTQDRRQHFRVVLHDQMCLVSFSGFKVKKFEALMDRKFEAKIIDISLSGMKFSCDFSLPVKSGITILLTFTLKEEDFQLEGEILRKEEHHWEEAFSYGIRFQSMPPQTEHLLNHVLQQIIIENQK